MGFALHSSAGVYLRIPAFPTPDACVNPQDAVEYIIGHLTTNLSAKLDLIEQEYNDGIELPDVDNYWRAPQERYPGNLNIVVVPAQAQPINSGDQRQEFTILVELIVAGKQSKQTGGSTTKTGTELILTRTWRTYRAIYELLNKNTLSNQVGYTLVNDATPSELLTDGKQYEQRLEIDLTVYTA
jgi:hypothetical protein